MSTNSYFTEDIIKAIEALLNAIRLESEKWVQIGKAETILNKLRAEAEAGNVEGQGDLDGILKTVDRGGGPNGGFKRPPGQGEGGGDERPGRGDGPIHDVDRGGGTQGGGNVGPGHFGGGAGTQGGGGGGTQPPVRRPHPDVNPDVDSSRTETKTAQVK